MLRIEGACCSLLALTATRCSMIKVSFAVEFCAMMPVCIPPKQSESLTGHRKWGGVILRLSRRYCGEAVSAYDNQRFPNQSTSSRLIYNALSSRPWPFVARKYKCRATHSHPIQGVLPISKIFLQMLQYWLLLRRLFSGQLLHHARMHVLAQRCPAMHRTLDSLARPRLARGSGNTPSPCAAEGSSLSMTHFQTMAKTGKIQLVAAEREEELCSDCQLFAAF